MPSGTRHWSSPPLHPKRRRALGDSSTWMRRALRPRGGGCRRQLLAVPRCRARRRDGRPGHGDRARSRPPTRFAPNRTAASSRSAVPGSLQSGFRKCDDLHVGPPRMGLRAARTPSNRSARGPLRPRHGSGPSWRRAIVAPSVLDARSLTEARLCAARASLLIRPARPGAAVCGRNGRPRRVESRWHGHPRTPGEGHRRGHRRPAPRTGRQRRCGRRRNRTSIGLPPGSGAGRRPRNSSLSHADRSVQDRLRAEHQEPGLPLHVPRCRSENERLPFPARACTATLVSPIRRRRPR